MYSALRLSYRIIEQMSGMSSILTCFRVAFSKPDFSQRKYREFTNGTNELLEFWTGQIKAEQKKFTTEHTENTEFP